MAVKKPDIDKDPELIRQMAAAVPKDDAVEAVFILSPDNPADVVPSPERTEELTRQVLERVKKHVGKEQKRLNIFRNMGSFVISAHPSFLRELMSQPEIATAMANRQSNAPIAGPVKKRAMRSPSRKKTASAKKVTNAGRKK